jgi:membrane-associated PAP2 superfamily phosphatase
MSVFSALIDVVPTQMNVALAIAAIVGMIAGISKK